MLEVINLVKQYGAKTPVAGLNFTVGPNEVVGLLGPNGAGKTTTMRMITGYLAPTAGTVSMQGIDITQAPLAVRAQIGYLPELPPLYMDMTVKEHLGFVCDLRNIPRRGKAPEIDRVCRALHIGDVSHRLIRNLSKGYRQRVGFAAALIGSPKLLILDEPTVGLDPRQMVEIRELILELSKSMSVILSSHILAEIATVCNRLIIMNRGQIAAQGTPEEIHRTHARPPKVELEVRGDQTLVRQILAQQFTQTLTVETEQLGADTISLTLACAQLQNPCEQLFQAFSRHSDTLSLRTLRLRESALEDVFMDIIQN